MKKFEEALHKYAKYVIQQSRSNLTKGKNNASKELYSSLEYKIKGDKISFLSEDYGPFIDKGVKGAKSTYAESKASPFAYTNKQPPAIAFEKWIKQKNIQGRDKKTGRFISHQSLSYIIARSIYSKGIRATLFFTKPFERGIELYGDKIISAYMDDNLNKK